MSFSSHEKNTAVCLQYDLTRVFEFDMLFDFSYYTLFCYFSIFFLNLSNKWHTLHWNCCTYKLQLIIKTQTTFSYNTFIIYIYQIYVLKLFGCTFYIAHWSLTVQTHHWHIQSKTLGTLMGTWTNSLFFIHFFR